MGSWPGKGATRMERAYVQVTASGSTNTKGSWELLFASTPFDAQALRIQCGQGVSDTQYLVDIAVGASSSEQVIIADFHYANEGSFGSGILTFPISIPAGSRISTRSQASVGSANMDVLVWPIDQSFLVDSSLGIVTTYGADTSDSGGLVVDPGAVADTNGSWKEFSASTVAEIRWLGIAIGNRANTVMLNGYLDVDVGIGGSGVEEVIADDLFFQSKDNETILPWTQELAVQIPSGSRLSLRAASNITDATDRLFDFVLYGVS